jgi:hypothetical protein
VGAALWVAADARRRVPVRAHARHAGRRGTAQPPGPVVADFDEAWPGDFDDWKKVWQPKQPSPVIKFMREQAEKRAREQRDKA